MRGKTQARKSEHIDIVLGEKTQARGVTTGFERFFLEHVALPEINLAEVDLSLSLWGRNLRAPLLISCMTGGTNRAGSINLHLAEAAQALGIAMGVGSQRAVLEGRASDASYQVRKVAPDILLLANLGAVQLNYGFGPDQARRAVEDIEADALVLHLNPLQEAVQPEGDQDWRGLYQKIENVAATIGVPVIAKEVGNGIGAAVARRLADCGVAAIDVAGAGGTSWSEVEAYRQSDAARREVAFGFGAWGIPTALALLEARAALPDLTLFASGGIRSGVDAAKAIAMGATLVGQAAPLLNPAMVDAAKVHDRFAVMIDQLRISAFCTGSRTLADLRRAVLRRADTWSFPTDTTDPRS